MRRWALSTPVKESKGETIMKKNLVRVLAFVLAGIMLLSLVTVAFA